MYNKLKEKLTLYINEKELDELLKTLKDKSRAYIINSNYFIKVGINKDKKFFERLVAEINLYRQNKNNVLLPEFIYGYDDDGICILVEKRLNGKPLSTERNSLKINGITGKDYLNIIDNIAKIKDYDISFKLDKS
ncbi:MAG: hypothetical protein PHS45_05180 [Bacilli bacterium]|nr:hypothetical protein [Bacilli bacterium]